MLTASTTSPAFMFMALKAPPLRAIFFDAGNTLLYHRLDERARDLTQAGFPATVESFHAAERTAKQKLDLWLWPQIQRREVPRAIDHYFWMQYLESLMGEVHAPQAEHARLVKLVYDGFREIRNWSMVMPETPAYLASLRQKGYFLGVISNSGGRLEDQMRHLGLRDYFHTVIDSAVVGVEKPHPEIFELALARAGVSANQSLFLGDTNATDVGGAQVAGLHAVLMDLIDAYPQAASPRIKTLPELDGVLASL